MVLVHAKISLDQTDAADTEAQFKYNKNLEEIIHYNYEERYSLVVGYCESYYLMARLR